MNWKGPLLAAAVLLAVIVAYSALFPEPAKSLPPQAPEKFAFSISVSEFGLADSGNGSIVRAFVLARVQSSGVKNATAQLVLLANPPAEGIYEVTDYGGSADKQQAVASMRAGIAPYNLGAGGGPLEDATGLNNSVIVVPSDAMPDGLADGGLLRLLNGNVVVFFGKPLDITMDNSGSQNLIGNSLYDALNVTVDSRGAIAPRTGGPKISSAGNATVLEYPHGWLVLYDDSGAAAREMAGLILAEGWQSQGKVAAYNLTMNGTRGADLYSVPSPAAKYYIRLLVSAFSASGSYVGKMDMGPAEPLRSTLRIPEISGTGKAVPYSFELHDDLEYPARYDLRLQFVRDGKAVDTVAAKTVTMKTVARESGAVSPNITSGNYLVRLIDQDGAVHALAYTHIPTVKLSLVRIEGNDHVFRVTVDGRPLQRSRFNLTADNSRMFSLETGEEGEARVAFILGAGVHSFTAEAGGERATAYYRKAQEDDNTLLYVVGVAGVAFLALTVAGTRKEKKWTIRTHPQPAERSRILKLPYGAFLDLFRMTQKSRAEGLPLSVSDLRLGIRRHATYRGAPVFLTDSNIFHLLDGMVKKGRMLSSDGYFLPAEMAGGRPIEYWVMKRKISDYLISHGEEFGTPADADFMIRGKLVHIWGGEPGPDRLLSLSRKHDNIILFPDAARKAGFMAKASAYDPAWMKVLLEIQYGRIYCQTLEEYLELGLHAKG